MGAIRAATPNTHSGARLDDIPFLQVQRSIAQFPKFAENASEGYKIFSVRLLRQRFYAERTEMNRIGVSEEPPDRRAR
jgi:hypothetical protein